MSPTPQKWRKKKRDSLRRRVVGSSIDVIDSKPLDVWVRRQFSKAVEASQSGKQHRLLVGGTMPSPWLVEQCGRLVGKMAPLLVGKTAPSTLVGNRAVASWWNSAVASWQNGTVHRLPC